MAVPLKQLISQYQQNNGKWTPYDPTLASVLGSSASDLTHLGTEYSHGVNTTAIDFADQRHKLDMQRRKDFEANAENFGDRGMIRSGIFAKSQGDLGNQYAQSYTDLNAARQKTLAGLRDTKLRGENSIRQTVTSAYADATERAKQQKAQAAQQAAEAAHAKVMEELQRQQIAAEIAAAKAQQNAFRNYMGSTGQTQLGAGAGQDLTGNPLQQFQGMNAEEIRTLQVIAYFKALQQAQEQQKLHGVTLGHSAYY